MYRCQTDDLCLGLACFGRFGLVGDATIEMTMRYAHLSPDVNRDAVSLLDAPASNGTMTAPLEEPKPKLLETKEK